MRKKTGYDGFVSYKLTMIQDKCSKRPFLQIRKM